MEYYVCDLYEKTNWHLPPSVVAERTFKTEREATEWFIQHYGQEMLTFTGFIFDGNYFKNYVSCKGKEIGYINKYFPNEFN